MTSHGPIWFYSSHGFIYCASLIFLNYKLRHQKPLKGGSPFHSPHLRVPEKVYDFRIHA